MYTFFTLKCIYFVYFFFIKYATTRTLHIYIFLFITYMCWSGLGQSKLETSQGSIVVQIDHPRTCPTYGNIRKFY